jgi:subtilisin family serine protease
LSEVLGVGAVDDDGTVAPFSNGGEATRSKRRERTGSDLWAPGVDVLAAWPVAKAMEGHGILQDDAAPYARLSGTSFSCAVVTGLAALYAGITGLRGAALRQLLVRTAPQGRVRFDPPVDSTTSPIPASSQAEPERDVVVLQIREGPELILHPQTARALFGVAKTSVR